MDKARCGHRGTQPSTSLAFRRAAAELVGQRLSRWE